MNPDTFLCFFFNLSQEKVDYLLSRNDIEGTSYMNRFNLIDGYILDYETLEKFLAKGEKDVDVLVEKIKSKWYKGNIRFDI